MSGWEANYQNWFGEGYIRAVAGAVGLNAGPPTAADVIGVDLAIADHDESVKEWPAVLWVQLKTVQRSQVRFGRDLNGEQYFTYDLSVSNFNKLVKPTATPYVLVVFLVPDSRDLWMAHIAEKTEMRWGAYWVRLTGQAPSTNSTTVAVRIPLHQQFSHTQLRELMRQVGEKGAEWTS